MSPFLVDALAQEGIGEEKIKPFREILVDDVYASQWLPDGSRGVGFSGRLSITGQAYFMDCMKVNDLRKSDGKTDDIKWRPWPSGNLSNIRPNSPAGGLPMVWDSQYGNKVRALLKFRNAEGPIYHNLLVAWNIFGDTWGVPQPQITGAIGIGPLPTVLPMLPSLIPPGKIQ